MRKTKLYLILAFQALTFTRFLEAAAPSITGNTGTVSNNQTIILSGVNFGTSTQKPFVYTDFENGSNNPDGTLGFTSSWNNFDLYTVVQTTNNRSGSVYLGSATYSVGNTNPGYEVAYTPGLDKTYLQEVRYANGHMDPQPNCGGNVKYYRSWPNPGHTGAFDLVCGWGSGSCQECDNEGDSDSQADRYMHAPQWPEIQWYNEEYITLFNGDTGVSRDGTPRTCDGLAGHPPDCTGGLYLIRDGDTIGWRHEVYNGPTLRQQIDIGEMVLGNLTLAPPYGSFFLMDDIFFSTGISRVMVSTSSTWALSSGFRKAMPQSNWTNNGQSITFTLKIADMPSPCNAGTGCYAYVVTDATGTTTGVNANGFLLASSGASSTKPALIPIRK